MGQGVMIEHSAVVATVAATLTYLGQVTVEKTMDESDCMLSYLPLAHIFDRWVSHTAPLLHWASHWELLPGR